MFYVKIICKEFRKFEMKNNFLTAILYLSFLHYSLGEKCSIQNACQCIYANGSVIDLTDLGYENKPRFSNTDAKNYTYFFNPCHGFNMGPADSACSTSKVAVCQVSSTKEYQDCGDASSAHFEFLNNSLHLFYTTSIRTTNVTLVCSREAEEPQLIFTGETSSRLYEMTLITKCACPDMCRKSHLSAGSVLIIIFMIFLALYLVLGIIHSSLTRGANGWELIPHHEFWADFPSLVRDGCVFFVETCLCGKSERSYESI